MSGIEPNPTPTPASPFAGIVDRVKNILLTPKAEWQRIAAEPATLQSLFVPYALALAAIGPVATLIGSVAFARVPIGSALIGAVVSYVLALVSVAGLGFIIEVLAPQFGAVRDRVGAFKVAIYGSTAGWLAGIFMILGPTSPLAFLGIVGLYSAYLIYLGLGPVMRAPEDKQVVYTVVVIIAWILLMIVASLIVRPLLTPSLPPNALQPGQMAFPPPVQTYPAGAYPPGTYPQQPVQPGAYPQQPAPPTGYAPQQQPAPMGQYPQQPPPFGYQQPQPGYPQQPYPQQPYPQQPQSQPQYR